MRPPAFQPCPWGALCLSQPRSPGGLIFYRGPVAAGASWTAASAGGGCSLCARFPSGAVAELLLLLLLPFFPSHYLPRILKQILICQLVQNNSSLFTCSLESAVMHLLLASVTLHSPDSLVPQSWSLPENFVTLTGSVPAGW